MNPIIRWWPLATALALAACNPMASSSQNRGSALIDPAKRLQLSQLCMEGGRKFFQDQNEPVETGGLKRTPSQTSYFIAHYNGSLNKCFVLVSFNDASAQGTTEIDNIYDAFEGAEYAGFDKTIGTDQVEHIFECEEGSPVRPVTTCHTREQWNAIVAKYMGREE